MADLAGYLCSYQKGSFGLLRVQMALAIAWAQELAAALDVEAQAAVGCRARGLSFYRRGWSSVVGRLVVGSGSFVGAAERFAVASGTAVVGSEPAVESGRAAVGFGTSVVGWGRFVVEAGSFAAGVGSFVVVVVVVLAMGSLLAG